MRSKLLMIALISFMAIRSSATIVVVTLAGTSFSPANFTVNPGDSIKWVVSSGSHNTISAVIPADASPWSSVLDATTLFFIYVPAADGDYTYRCDIHGEEGSFTVTTPAKVGNVTNDKIFSLSPNPASGILHISFAENNSPATVSIVDLNGRSVLKQGVNSGAADIDVKGITNGIYLVLATQGGKTTSQQVMIAN